MVFFSIRDRELDTIEIVSVDKPEPEPEPEERDSQLQVEDQSKQSAEQTKDSIIPEPEPEPEPEERDSQLQVEDQSKQSGEQTKDSIIPEPEPLIFAYTDVGPIDFPEDYILEYEKPYLSYGQLGSLFELEPEDLQPFSDELLALILNDLPHAVIEEPVETKTLEEEQVEIEQDLDIETPPSLTIITPENNGFYRSEVNVSFRIANNVGDDHIDRISSVYWIPPDGAEVEIPLNEENELGFLYSSIGHSGPLNIKIVVMKDNGLVDEKIILLQEDLKGPHISIISPEGDREGPFITLIIPEENSEFDSQIIIKGSLKSDDEAYVDIDGIDSLFYSIGTDENKKIDFNENGNFETSINSSDLVGLNFVVFSALDKNGHMSSFNLPIFTKEPLVALDILPPEINILVPENNSTYHSKVRITGSVINEVDSSSSDQITEFYWAMAGDNQKNNIDYTQKGSFDFQISTVDLNNNLDIKFTAVKADKVKREVLLSLMNDKIGPEIQLNTPENAEYFSNSIKVSGLVSDIVDGNNEVKSLYWSISSEPENNNLIFFEDDGSFDFEINMEDINGLVNFQLTAFDLNNNIRTESVILNDGKKPPVIIVETPEAGAQYGAGIKIKGKISDPYSWNPEFGGIESVSILLEPYGALGSGEIIESDISFDQNGTFEHIFRTDQREGDQKLLIRVLAKNGNISEDSIQITQGEFPISDFTISQGDKKLILDWTTLPFIPNYFINYTNDGSTPSEESTLSLNNVKPPLVLSGLSNGSLYSFLLTGETEDGIVQSDIISSVPMAYNTLEPYARSEFGFIEISWLDASGVDSYLVLRSSDNEPYIDISGEVFENRYIDRSGVFGKTYQYKITPYKYTQVDSYPVTAELLSEPPERLTNMGSLKNLKPEVIRIEGDYAYVASKEEGFYIVDISDPSQMVIRGFILITGAEDLSVSGDYVVIASGEDGFTVINISEPASPRIVGSRKTTDANSVDIENNYIYIGDGIKGVKIYSLENPKRPPRVYFNDQYEAYDVTVSDHKLYISSGDQGLNIFDISNPEYPEKIGSFEGIEILSSEIQGNYCYSASGEGGLNILDISNPAEPSFCSNYKTENAQSLMLADNHVMIADGEGGLLDIDVTDPYRPESFESMDLTFSTSVDVSENLILVADRSGLYTVESFQHGQSFKISELETEGDANSITIMGNYLYIADHSKGFVIVDLNNPGEIDEGSVLFTVKTDYAEQIVINGEKIYLADGSGGIKTFEILENNPVLKEIIDIDGNAKKIIVTEDYILAAAGPGGLQGKKRDYINPIPLEAVDDKMKRFSADISIMFPDARDLVFFQDYIYLVDRKRGLIVIDFQNYENPDTIMEISMPGAKSIDHFENRVYIGHADGVSIYDISDKDFPEEIGLIESAYVEDIKIVGTILYVAEGHAGLSVYDVKDTKGILKVSACEDVFADSVTVSGEYAYIADSTGINVVKIYIPQWIKQRY